METNRSTSHPSPHLSFSRIQQYIEGQLQIVDRQICSHHIMHCPRCEAVWEQLIKETQKTAGNRSVFSRILSLVFF